MPLPFQCFKKQRIVGAGFPRPPGEVWKYAFYKHFAQRDGKPVPYDTNSLAVSREGQSPPIF